MNYLFIMCPLGQVNPKKDTSYALMCGAHRRGHAVYHVRDGDIALKDGKLLFLATSVIPKSDPDSPFEITESRELGQDEVDVVFIRTDPPFDVPYLLQTWLLEKLPPQIPVLNRPEGIRTVNEKIWVTQFQALIPDTLVTREKKHFLEFLSHHGKIVAKPAHGYGGAAVFCVDHHDTNRQVIFETLTQNGSESIILQEYLPASVKGDKRILLLNGEALGAVLRVHSDTDHRNNFFSGGRAEPTVIAPHDEAIIAVLRPHLRRLGLYLVGIDIIGGRLIEVNVTSPTCLPEMNRFDNKTLEDKVIAFSEQLKTKAKEKLTK